MTVKHVVAAASPDNNFAVLTNLLDSATESIHTSVYQLDNLAIGEAYERALGRGVKVQILLEGSPIPKIPQAELYIAKRLTSRGAKVHFYDRAKDSDRGTRTFKYFHNKFTVVDGRRAIVGSANYGNNGHPVDNSFGNREWEVVLDDSNAAQLFDEAFNHDRGLTGEWAAYGSSPRYKADPSFDPSQPKTRSGHYEARLEPFDAYDVPTKTVFAPENSLDDSPMLAVLEHAQETVDVEQLNLETYWGGKPYNPETEDSPLIKSLLSLARAGKAVRILLNNDAVFHEPQPKPLAGVLDLMALFDELPEHLFRGVDDDSDDEPKPKRDNYATREYLGKIAQRENLRIAVRLLDFKNCGLGVLHNKAMIVDGNVTFVSSLNWGESPMKFNREAGVLLKSSPIATYYSKAFEYDWRCSGRPRSFF
ncbi:MAG: hypothetical protein HY075_06145 [Deltaproteobacteria bacterium]|nr:hypothetical protein [Deltaproteobacteria bacterium]